MNEKSNVIDNENNQNRVPEPKPVIPPPNENLSSQEELVSTNQNKTPESNPIENTPSKQTQTVNASEDSVPEPTPATSQQIIPAPSEEEQVTPANQPAIAAENTNNSSPESEVSNQKENVSQQEKILATNTAVSEENQNINNEDEEEPKQKKKKSKLPLILFILILLIGGTYLFYNFYLMNEETIIKNETKKVFAFVTEKINKLEKNTFDYDIEKESLGIEGNVSLSSNYKNETIDLSKLNDYNITYNGSIDKNNNKLSGSIALNKKNDKLLSSDIYMEGKDILIKLNELFDKALKSSYEQELKDIETTKSLNYNNIKTILKKTEEITLNTIDKEKLSKKLVQKEINNKKDYYIEVIYKLNIEKYTTNLIDGYSKDEEIIKILAELTNQTNDEIKKSLEETKKSIEDSSSEDTILDIVFYMDKITGSFKEVEIISKEKDYENKEIINKYIIYKTDNIYNFEYNNNGKKDTTGTYDLSKNELTITNKNENSSTSFVLTEIDDNTYSISLNSSTKDSYSLSVVAKINNKISSESQTTSTNVIINYTQDKENINTEINNTITITKGKKPEELKTNDYIEIESLTEEQINTMKQKATNIIESILKDFIKDQTKVPDLSQAL